MADKPLQGGEVFEITDHTTASDWERFIANLEELLTEWQLNQSLSDHQKYQLLPEGAISRGIWREKHDVIRWRKVNFELRYQYIESDSRELDETRKESKGPDVHGHPGDGSSSPEFEDAMSDDECIARNDPNESEAKKKKEVQSIELVSQKSETTPNDQSIDSNMPECLRDLMSQSNDYASKAHCLVRWYNLRKFLTLSIKADTIVSEDKVKLILSAASIALANVNCHVPFFVQIQNPRNFFYQGISEHCNIRTMYEMVFFKSAYEHYNHLSELVPLFRKKICAQLNDPILVSVRLNYCLSLFDLFVDSRDEFQGNEHEEGSERQREVEAKKNLRPLNQDMRSGATFEQVVEALEECIPHPFRIIKFLHIAAYWAPTSDKVMSETSVHSSLDPTESRRWTIRSVINDNCNMKIVHETQAIYELLSKAIDYAYNKLDAKSAFKDCDEKTLRSRCLRLAYDLSIQPEVVLSEDRSDSIRKLIALMFHRASEIRSEDNALDQLAAQLKQKPSLDEIYQEFGRRNRPSVKEYIIKAELPRPFTPKSTPALPQRMFCTITPNEFRLCGAFSELCN